MTHPRPTVYDCNRHRARGGIPHQMRNELLYRITQNSRYVSFSTDCRTQTRDSKVRSIIPPVSYMVLSASRVQYSRLLLPRVERVNCGTGCRDIFR